MLNLILSALPALGSLIAGGKGAEVASAGEKIAREIFGTTDEAVIAQRMEADPKLAEQFKAKLEAETSALRMQIEDTQDARATAVKLSEGGGWNANATALLTGLNYLGFYASFIIILVLGLPEAGGARELVSGMVGAVIGAYLNSNQFWFGTSAGSARSGDAIRQIAQQATTPTAGQVAGKVIDAAVKTVAKR